MSGDSGSVLKVHDYIGLAEVSSTLSQPPFAVDALPSPQDLNLEETDLRLGLGPAKKPDAPKLPCEKPLADPHPEKPRQPEKLKPLSDAKYSEDQRPSQASLPQSQSGRNGSQPCLPAAQDFAYEAPKIVNGYGRTVMVPALPSKNGMKRVYDNISGAVHFSSSGDGRPPVSAISGAAKNGDFDVKSLPKHQQGAFLPNWASSKSSVPVPWHVGLDQPVSSNKPAVPKPATAAAYKPCDPVENPSDVATTDAPPSKSRVVGWPPVATFRKQQTIAKPTEMFVKVNMDGITVGRKVDLNAHSSYDSLFQALEDMFQPSLNAQSSGRDSVACEKQCWLRNGLDYVLTYEDKDGDWMLVGDVPWSFFVNTVKRLRIVRGSDATGSAPRGPDIV